MYSGGVVVSDSQRQFKRVIASKGEVEVSV
jgi:hypothetical protein